MSILSPHANNLLAGEVHTPLFYFLDAHSKLSLSNSFQCTTTQHSSYSSLTRAQYPLMDSSTVSIASTSPQPLRAIKWCNLHSKSMFLLHWLQDSGSDTHCWVRDPHGNVVVTTIFHHSGSSHVSKVCIINIYVCKIRICESRLQLWLHNRI